MFEQVKQEIDNKIKTNGNNEITATRLNSVLQDMMDASAEVIEEVQRSIGDQVEANPTEAATDSLEKIKIGEKVYDIPDPDTSNFVTSQELQQELNGYVQKTDPPSPAVGDLVVFDEFGGFGTSEKKVTDFATAAQGAKADTAVQPSATTGLLKNDGTVDTQTAGRAESALQPLSGAQENNFASFDANGGIKDSGCNESTFIKGVKQNGTLITPVSGVVDVTVQDGEDGLSAFEIAQQQGYTGTVDQWLASLKANIGAFKFVSYDSSAESAFTTGGIGTTYSGTIDGLTVGTDTTPDVILLMNDDATTPSKTMMIATQEVTPATTPASYEFIYAGDLQSAMPSNVLTQANIVNDLTTGGSTNVASAALTKSLNEKVVELEGDILGDIDEIVVPYDDFYVGLYQEISGGYITQQTNKCYVLAISPSLRGKHIKSSNNVYQHGFCSAYVYQDHITYCQGTQRIATKIDNEVVPEDCSYIYLYIATSTNGVTITNLDSQHRASLREEVDTAKTKADTALAESENLEGILTPIIPRLEDFTYAYSFNGTNQRAILENLIELQSNGDSIEFTVDDVDEDVNAHNRLYTLMSGSNENRVGIGISTKQIAIRSDYIPDGQQGQVFILNASNVTGDTIGKTFKVSYENGNIVTYVNGTPTWTYTGQLPLKISGFGYCGTVNAQYSRYWHGKISNLKVNGEIYIISQKSQTSNVPETAIGTILSPEEQAAIDSNTPVMMFEKSANEADVYIKNSDGSYVKYPLEHRIHTLEQTPPYYNNWGVGRLQEYTYLAGVMTRAHYLFQGGEAEFAIKCQNANSESYSFAGGAAHGYEVIAENNGVRDITMLLNGHLIEEDSVLPLQPADKFEVFHHSLLYRNEDTTNHWAELMKHWTFTKEGLTIETKLKVLEAVPFKNAYFAMFCVYGHLDGEESNANLTSFALENDNMFKRYSIEIDSTNPWWVPDNANNPNRHLVLPSRAVTKISEYGDAGYGFSVEIVNTSEFPTNQGGMFVSTNNNQTAPYFNSYNKIYFDINGETAYTPSVNQEFYATQKWCIYKSMSND